MTDPILLSLGQLAPEFGVTRDVLRRILSEATVAPVAKRGGHPVYRLRDVYVAILAQHQPDEMNPHARLALARAVKVEDEIKVKRRELVPIHDVLEAYAAGIKPIRQALEIVPDQLERDAALSPQQVVAVERVLDALRTALAMELQQMFGEGGE